MFKPFASLIRVNVSGWGHSSCSLLFYDLQVRVDNHLIRTETDEIHSPIRLCKRQEKFTSFTITDPTTKFNKTFLDIVEKHFHLHSPIAVVKNGTFLNAG